MLSGPERLELVVEHWVVVDDLFVGAEDGFGGCDPTDVCLMTRADVISHPLHEGGFLSEDPYFFGGELIEHRKPNI